MNCAHMLVKGDSVVLWPEGFVHKVRCMHCKRKYLKPRGGGRSVC